MNEFAYNPETDKEFISLYDFLGKPAGGELGTKVWKAAVEKREPHKNKVVETPRYHGKIIMYRKSFLEEYFQQL